MTSWASEALKGREGGLVNVEYLDELTGSDKGLMSEIVATYVESAHAILDEISGAIGKEDAVRAYRAAHSLKGASGSAGAETVRELAFELEQALRSGNFAPTSGLLSRARGALQTTIESYTDIGLYGAAPATAG